MDFLLAGLYFVGELVGGFLESLLPPEQYIADLTPHLCDYNGFNLLVANLTGDDVSDNISRLVSS